MGYFLYLCLLRRVNFFYYICTIRSYSCNYLHRQYSNYRWYFIRRKYFCNRYRSHIMYRYANSRYCNSKPYYSQLICIGNTDLFWLFCRRWYYLPVAVFTYRHRLVDQHNWCNFTNIYVFGFNIYYLLQLYCYLPYLRFCYINKCNRYLFVPGFKLYAILLLLQ